MTARFELELQQTREYGLLKKAVSAVHTCYCNLVVG